MTRVKDRTRDVVKLQVEMKRFQRQRLRSRLSILAVVALLWSQAVFAAHPACALAAMALSELQPTSVAMQDCHAAEESSGDAVCTPHCDQGNQTNDTVRVPPVPSLQAPCVAPIDTHAAVQANHRLQTALPPKVSWHRPTAHPAALLLI